LLSIATISSIMYIQGQIQDFKLGGALKIIAPGGARRENFGGISCEKSRFYAKQSYFFQFDIYVAMVHPFEVRDKMRNKKYHTV